MDSDSDNAGSKVIARAAQLLRAIEDDPDGVTITALARRTGMPRSTVHRLVSALEAEQLLMNGAGKVRVGPALARMAASAHIDVVSLSRPAIETLGRRTRETIDLSVFRGSYALLVSQFASDQELRVVSSVGTAFPCHCTAPGKALLAALPDEQLELMYAVKPEVRTANSLSSRAAILQEMEKIRRQGFAIDLEEHAMGVCAVSVAIHSALNERYAVSVAVPALRFEASVDTLLASLRQCKAEIEELLIS
ncbi:IclR family transcriptional regulator [Pantoea cypripedii]|uniref:IclR family transcriptional regulator n=1 Tax=Pantoea cypripedii TaxID=55209 RepID=UPI002FCBF99B